MAKKTLPRTIKDKKAEAVQGWFIFGGVGAGLISWVAFSNGAPETGFWSAVITVALLWIASKIKTTKNLKGGLYR